MALPPSRRLAALVAVLTLVAAACATSTETTEVAIPVETSTTSTTEVPSTTQSTTATEAPASTEAPTTTTEAPPEPVGDANQRLVGDFTDLNGDAVDLSDFHNSDVVLWMWAPW